jgi:hypothetical protein
MPFNIRMGLPEMAALWQDISTRKLQGKLDTNEAKLFSKLVKSLGLLAANPRHPGLQSHEIRTLTQRYGFKVFQSYLENNTPAAGRLFWTYGPDKGDITVIGMEPHPEEGAYGRVKLSNLPPAKPKEPTKSKGG